MSSAGSKGVEGPAGPLVNENFVTLSKNDFDNYLEEIEHLRQQNAELVEALERCLSMAHSENAVCEIVIDALIEATGGE